MLKRKYVSQQTRNEIAKEHEAEYGNNCYYCGIDLTEVGVHIDHVVPVSWGGEDGLKVLSCPMCNRAKNDLFVEEFLKYLSHLRSSKFRCSALELLESKTRLSEQEVDRLKGW